MRALPVTKWCLFVGNSVVFPIAAFSLRHVTLTPANWRAWIDASLVVGVALPTAVVLAVCFAGVREARRGDARTAPAALAVFAVLWSAPGLATNHNAVSDRLSGPRATVVTVSRAAPLQRDDGSNLNRRFFVCGLTFADGSRREVDRYAVPLLGAGDPCHGIRAGDRCRRVVLAGVDELLAIEPVMR